MSAMNQFHVPGEAVISSIGVDGLGYQEYKTGSNLLVSFTRIENIFIWAARDKGKEVAWAFMMLCF